MAYTELSNMSVHATQHIQIEVKDARGGSVFAEVFSDEVPELRKALKRAAKDSRLILRRKAVQDAKTLIERSMSGDRAAQEQLKDTIVHG